MPLSRFFSPIRRLCDLSNLIRTPPAPSAGTSGVTRKQDYDSIIYIRLETGVCPKKSLHGDRGGADPGPRRKYLMK